MHRLVALILVIALGGCGAQSAVAPPVVAPNTEVARSVEQEGRFLAFVGPRRQHADPFLGVPATNFYTLRSLIDARTGETTHQLYVEDSYFGSQRKWDAARDAQGEELRFTAIADNEITCESSCSYAEEFAAALPEELLRASPGGLTVTFSAQSGVQKTIAVPGELIQKQLAAIDAARVPRPSAALPSVPSAARGRGHG